MRFAFLVRIYTAARGLMRNRWGRGRGGERLLPSTPLPPFSGWTSFRLSHDCIFYLPTTKNKKNTSYAARLGKKGALWCNNSVVAGVPFSPFLACPNSPFSQPSFQGSLLRQRRPHAGLELLVYAYDDVSSKKVSKDQSS